MKKFIWIQLPILIFTNIVLEVAAVLTCENMLGVAGISFYTLMSSIICVNCLCRSWFEDNSCKLYRKDIQGIAKHLKIKYQTINVLLFVVLYISLIILNFTLIIYFI